MSGMIPGRRYPRPCVRTIWNRMRKPGWVPVLGPAHDDAEIIRFEPRHWHVDFRFLPKNMRGDGEDRRRHAVFSTPVSTVWPEGTPNGEWVRVDDLSTEEYPVESYLRVMNRTFHENYPGYPERVSWIPKLEEAYRDAELLPGPVCPHRMAPLAGLEADEEGCVTCPLHGLRWDLATGRLASLGREGE